MSAGSRAEFAPLPRNACYKRMLIQAFCIQQVAPFIAAQDAKHDEIDA